MCGQKFFRRPGFQTHSAIAALASFGENLFQDHGGNAAANRLRPDLNRPKQVLKGYPLESLKLVGVWRRGKDVYALIKADAVVHPVKTGSYLGSNFGMVIAIRDNEVLLRELIQDASGEWAERRTELTMQSGGAGK